MNKLDLVNAISKETGVSKNDKKYYKLQFFLSFSTFFIFFLDNNSFIC